MKAAGGPTDTSRDHEVADWAQVERFVVTFAKTVQVPTELAAAGA